MAANALVLAIRALLAAVVLALLGWVVVVLGGGIHRGERRLWQPNADMRATTAAARARTYPDRDGRPLTYDPTYGRVDRDIQWMVQDLYQPNTVAQRVVMELNLQARRRGGRLR